MSYSVKEIYHTLQGEGFHTGRPAVLLRFAGCNLWSGVEADRTTAICQFCDTDFVGTDGPGGGKFSSAQLLANAVAATWDDSETMARFVVLTGGEPLLQLDGALLSELQERGFEVAIETNGTLPVPAGVDWICVSPKAGAAFVHRSGHELKLVYPQEGITPESLVDLEFEHFFLQPMDGPERERNTEMAFEYAAGDPRWKVSIQTHKVVGLR